MKAIVYTRADGTTVIVRSARTANDRVSLTDEQLVARARARLPGDATGVRVIEDSEIPKNRTFRDAWRNDFSVDMDKAREITRDRVKRRGALTPELDEEIATGTLLELELLDRESVKAHQREIRERRAELELDRDLLGKWWLDVDTDITRATVRPVDYTLAERVILDYEWLACMRAIVRFSYGIFFGDVCGGVVVYSPDYAENLGVWDRYGYSGRIVLLARGACTHWSPPHSASKLIRGSMQLLPKPFEVVTATVDHRAGEVGTIYQASGFLAARMSTTWATYGVAPDGTRVSTRTMRHRCGSGSAAGRELLGLTAEREPPKLRYFGFTGSAGQQKRDRRAIAHLVVPYPKRGKSQERDAGIPFPEGVVRFDDPAPFSRALGEQLELAL